MTIVNETFCIETAGLYKRGFVFCFCCETRIKNAKISCVPEHFLKKNQPQHPEEDIHIPMKTKVKIFLIGAGDSLRISKRLTVRGARVSFPPPELVMSAQCPVKHGSISPLTNAFRPSNSQFPNFINGRFHASQGLLAPFSLYFVAELSCRLLGKTFFFFPNLIMLISKS